MGGLFSGISCYRVGRPGDGDVRMCAVDAGQPVSEGDALASKACSMKPCIENCAEEVADAAAPAGPEATMGDGVRAI